MKVKMTDLAGKAGKEIELNDAIYSLEIRKDVLHRYVEWQRANSQAGTHKTKERGEVAGTTKKIYRQKGTGGARHGSKKAPIFVGGGQVFGPRVRSHGYSLTKKFKRLALKTALSAKQAEGKLRVIDTLVVKDSDAKTKAISDKLGNLGTRSALFVRGDNLQDGFTRSVRNLPNMDVLPVQGLNVYDILKHDDLFITEHALKAIEERLA